MLLPVFMNDRLRYQIPRLFYRLPRDDKKEVAA